MSKSVDDILKDLDNSGVFESPGPGSPALATVSPAVRKAPRGSSPPRGRTLGLFVLVAILVAIVGSIPLGQYALYPFAMLVTLIHETGHAIAATATGGTVLSLQLSPNLSGQFLSVGGNEALIAPAGYLGATLAGVALLLTPLRYARLALGALAVVPLLVLGLFHPADVFTGAWGAGLFLALVAAAWKLPRRAATFLQVLIGVEAALNAFRDLTALVLISSTSHMQTDATNMSNALFLPPVFWSVLWTVSSVILLVAALVLLVKRDLRAPSISG